MHFFHINGDMTHCLYGVCVEVDAFFMCQFPDFRDRFDGADFIVGKHHGNENSFWTDSRFQIFQSDFAIYVYIQICHTETMFFQIFTSMQNGMMFNFCGNNMIALIFQCFCHTPQCHIVTFGATCCKIDFRRLCIDGFCHLFSCFFHCLFTLFGNAVNAGCISVILCKIRKHCFQNFFSDRSCCCMIHINFCCHSLVLL